MKIPNSFLSELGYSELMVACRLYACINSRTAISANGFEITIKQETIAASCGLSVSTVKRSMALLESKGIVTHKYRPSGSQGFLGAYRYSLKPFSFLSDYFFVDNRVFKYGLSPREFYVYALFCKLKRSTTLSFFQSYNDLVRKTGIKRSEIVRIIDRLCHVRIVYRQKKRTRLGDYTDNTYFVVIYRQNKRIKRSDTKKRRAHRHRLFPLYLPIKRSVIKNNIINIAHIFDFVKGYDGKMRKNFSIDGGG